MQIRPENTAVDRSDRVQQMVMVAPVDSEVNEAQDVNQKHGQNRRQRFEVRAVRNLQLEHQDRDEDREHAIAERLESPFGHRIRTLYNARRPDRPIGCSENVRATNAWSSADAAPSSTTM